MRYLFDELNVILKKIHGSKACLLMLDFDGTLSSIVPSPDKAKIYPLAKIALQKLLKHKNIIVAIVSGRALKDVKNKVGIKGLIYAGSHGLEWQIGNKTFSAKIPQEYIKILPQIRKQLILLARRHKGAKLEDKGLALAFHYRQVSSDAQRLVKNQANLILLPFMKQKILEIIQSKKALDVRPRAKWTKGQFSLYLKKKYEKTKPLVIYIGDDATDEDAFKVLRQDITIKVGKNNNSLAKYFLKNPNQVASFLNLIVFNHCRLEVDSG